jgi:hypothetical protein
MRFFRQFASQPFGSILAQVLIALLFISGLLILQGWSMQVFQFGLVLLIAAALLQIGVGNIPPTANFRQSITMVLVSLSIIAAVFVVGILLVPYLVSLGER